MNKPPRRAASGVAMMKLGAVQCSVCYETFRSPGDFALATERCEHPLTGLTCADCLSMFVSTHIATQGLEFPYVRAIRAYALPSLRLFALASLAATATSAVRR
jgi:hypothetical protein